MRWLPGIAVVLVWVLASLAFAETKPGKSAKKETAVKKGTTAKKKAVPAKPPQHDDDGGGEIVRRTGPNVTLAPADLAGFSDQPVSVQKLIRTGLALTARDLTYRYGSADPAQGGMDCSGTVYYLLRQMGSKAPRDSRELYLWAKMAGTLRKVEVSSLSDPQLVALRPGDLLFWEGTYDIRRDPPISHVMIYLGLEKATNKPVMVGASDGRTYRGVRRNGVSVFDFVLPKPESKAKFVGFARVPDLQ